MIVHTHLIMILYFGSFTIGGLPGGNSESLGPYALWSLHLHDQLPSPELEVCNDWDSNKISCSLATGIVGPGKKERKKKRLMSFGP